MRNENPTVFVRKSAFAVLIVTMLLLMPISSANQKLESEETPADLQLTWVDCWMEHKEGNLNSSEQFFCDAYYSEAPTQRLYDLRWIFLDVAEDDVSEDWMEVQLNNLNAVFLPWGFQFQTNEVVIIADAVAESDDYYEEWTLREILPDLRAQLGLSEDDEIALEELKSQLAERHVSQDELDNITLDEEYNTAGAFRLASRARSESITIVIRPGLDAVGKSGGPPPEFQISRGSALELRSTLLNGNGLTTLPHEMGHYFGIGHTHAPNYNEAEADFGFEQRWTRMAHDGEAIRRVVGDDYSQPFGEPYLSYNGSEQDLMNHQELMGEAFIWPAWNFLYKGDQEKFNSLAEFVQSGELGETIYRTNFERNYGFEDGKSVEWYGFNCFWNNTVSEGQCLFGEDPVTRLNHHHALLQDSIFFENGTVSNLMSYITPPIEDVSSRRGITDEQEDIIRFTANSPMRMLLFNHCLGTDLCSDFPDNQEDAGESDEEEEEGSEGLIPPCCRPVIIEEYVAAGIVVVVVALAIMRRKR